MKKVAFLTGTFSAFSGIERQVQYQAEKRVAAGDRVVVFTFEADMQPTSDYRLIILGMPKSIFLQRIFRLLYPFLPWLVRGHLKQLAQFDEVICHQYPLTVLAAAAKKKYGARYTYFDHGVPPPSVMGNWMEKVYIWLFERLMISSLRQADHVVCISRYLQGEMKRLTGIEAEVQYDEYNHKMFYPGVDRTKIRQKYKLGDRPIILYIGRIAPHKNLQGLIQAFRGLNPSFRAALVIVGKRTFGGYGRYLDSLTTPDVFFAGYVPEEDIPAHYGAASVYATTTLWEGYDLPIVEARACGVPSVMFNIGPHPEIASDQDILVPVGDIRSFTVALEQQIVKGANQVRKPS